MAIRGCVKPTHRRYVSVGITGAGRWSIRPRRDSSRHTRGAHSTMCEHSHPVRQGAPVTSWSTDSALPRIRRHRYGSSATTHRLRPGDVDLQTSFTPDQIIHGQLVDRDDGRSKSQIRGHNKSVIYRNHTPLRPRRSIIAVDYATLIWIDQFNHCWQQNQMVMRNRA